jgi:hypothetical protein
MDVDAGDAQYNANNVPTEKRLQVATPQAVTLLRGHETEVRGLPNGLTAV